MSVTRRAMQRLETLPAPYRIEAKGACVWCETKGHGAYITSEAILEASDPVALVVEHVRRNPLCRTAT